MKVLLLYKQSSQTIYFDLKKRTKSNGFEYSPPHMLKRFQKTHDTHHRSLDKIKNILSHEGVSFDMRIRGRGSIDFNKYSHIITVGGDGTVLEAARSISGEHPVLAINSDPTWSVGNFCVATADTFQKYLDKFLNNKARLIKLNRLLVEFYGKKESILALNDILVCHSNPGAMSRYDLTIGKIKENQRSSGIWVATAAGSTGAICSAGGRVLRPITSKQIQYMPRELYTYSKKYKLKGGFVGPRVEIKIMSLNRRATIYVDGCHHSYPFPFGQSIYISSSKQPLHLVTK